MQLAKYYTGKFSINLTITPLFLLISSVPYGCMDVMLE